MQLTTLTAGPIRTADPLRTDGCVSVVVLLLIIIFLLCFLIIGLILFYFFKPTNQVLYVPSYVTTPVVDLPGSSMSGTLSGIRDSKQQFSKDAPTVSGATSEASMVKSTAQAEKPLRFGSMLVKYKSKDPFDGELERRDIKSTDTIISGSGPEELIGIFEKSNMKERDDVERKAAKLDAHGIRSMNSKLKVLNQSGSDLQIPKLVIFTRKGVKDETSLRPVTSVKEDSKIKLATRQKTSLQRPMTNRSDSQLGLVPNISSKSRFDDFSSDEEKK